MQNNNEKRRIDFSALHSTSSSHQLHQHMQSEETNVEAYTLDMCNCTWPDPTHILCLPMYHVASTGHGQPKCRVEASQPRFHHNGVCISSSSHTRHPHIQSREQIVGFTTQTCPVACGWTQSISRVCAHLLPCQHRQGRPKCHIGASQPSPTLDSSLRHQRVLRSQKHMLSKTTSKKQY